MSLFKPYDPRKHEPRTNQFGGMEIGGSDDYWAPGRALERMATIADERDSARECQRGIQFGDDPINRDKGNLSLEHIPGLEPRPLSTPGSPFRNLKGGR